MVPGLYEDQEVAESECIFSKKKVARTHTLKCTQSFPFMTFWIFLRNKQYQLVVSTLEKLVLHNCSGTTKML